MNLVDLSGAVINLLKAYAPLATRVTHNGVVDVRELNWRSVDFNYPCVRVAVERLSPVPSACTGKEYTVILQVIVFDNDESSRGVQEIVPLCLDALQGKRVDTTTIKSVTPFQVTEIRPRVPLQEEQMWTGVLTFQADVIFL